MLNGSNVSSGITIWQMRADGAVLVGAIISDGARRSVRMEHCLSELRRPLGITPGPLETHSNSQNDGWNRGKSLSYSITPGKFFFCFESLVSFHVTSGVERILQHIKGLPLWESQIETRSHSAHSHHQSVTSRGFSLYSLICNSFFNFTKNCFSHKMGSLNYPLT